MANTSKATLSGLNKDNKNVQEFSLKISEILDARNLPGDIDTSLLKKQVLDVLGGDKQKAIFLLEKDIEMFEYLPVALQKDPDILTLMVEKKPERYYMLPEKLQQDPKIQKIVLKSIISSGDICKFIAVISKYPKDKKLKVLADSLLLENPDFLSKGHNALIYDIFKNEKKIYDSIFTAGLLEITQYGVSLGSTLTLQIQKILSDLEGNSPDDVQEIIFSELLELVGLKKSQLGESSHKLLHLLGSSIAISQKSKKEDDDTTEDDLQEDETYEQDYEDTPSVGPYYYSSFGNCSRIIDPDGSSIVLDTKQFESMSEKSLENYMNFSKLMKYLGLTFLLESQQQRIQIATQVDFYEGEGMSAARTLKFLNSIGKNIGVPEKSYKNKDGEAKVGCFDTVGAAKHAFREILKNQKLGDIDVSGKNTGGKGIVEMYMKSVGLITEPFGEISIAKWNSPITPTQTDVTYDNQYNPANDNTPEISYEETILATSGSGRVSE